MMMEEKEAILSTSQDNELTAYISSIQWSHLHSDLTIQCFNGKINSHCSILSTTTPFLKEILLEMDEPFLVLPDVSLQTMKTLLTLLHNGTVNVPKTGIQSMIELIELLKLNIPFVTEETRLLPEIRPKVKFIRREVRNPQIETKKIPILSTQRTRSGRQVPHKKIAEDEVTDFVEEDSNTERFDENSTMTLKNHMKLIENRPTHIASEEIQGPSHLTELLSVADVAFNKFRPELSDEGRNNVIIEETKTTGGLIRDCFLCHKRILGRNALGRHIKTIHPAELGPYKCPMFHICGKTLESGVKVHKHMYTQHSKTNKPQYNTNEIGLIKEDNVKIHDGLVTLAKLQQDSKFPCNYSLDHTKEETCSESFNTATKFIHHMRQVHKTKPWICTECPELKRFQERQNFQYHGMTHDGKRSFVCDICSKCFANPRQLYSHRSLHLGKRFLCPNCGYHARSTANLRGHIRSKHEAPSFKCDACDKKFSTNNNLKNHQRIHTGETPYDCLICNEKFKRLHHLNSHLESKKHKDAMVKCLRKGISVPEALDPSKRSRSCKILVEDHGPIQSSHMQVSTEEQVLVESMVVINDHNQSYVMLDGHTVEIVQTIEPDGEV